MYELAFHPAVTRDLRGLDKITRLRILDKMQWLLEHVDEMRHKLLTAQWARTYRSRVGDYRVVCGIDREQNKVIVYAVGHRREIYRLR